MGSLLVVVLGLLAIAGVRVLAERVGVAAPLLLVLVGVAVSVLPGVPPVVVDPEWVLAGILPPLLFSSAVAMPAMDFRRAFGAVSGLSVVLVVVSSVVVGLLVSLLVPGLGIAGGIALGAILAPTDAAATAIVRRVGVTSRVVTVLDGEGLLNDATALVLLRAAIAASAVSVSIGGVVGQFALAVVVAVVLGIVVGRLGLAVRRRIADPTVNTVLSFATPFVASLPAEELGASGLVAAVAAGLVTGHGATRSLPVQHRLSDTESWRTVELVLEGTIFLLMGLELTAVLEDLHRDGGAVGLGLGLAAVALVATVVVRAGYVSGLVLWLRASARRGAAMQDQLQEMNAQLEAGEQVTIRGRAVSLTSPRRIAAFGQRLRLQIADIDYFRRAPLGPREGTVIVWAGMRGAVTLAAAQTLPTDFPERSLLVFVAFTVAAGSLLLQGGTLALLVRWIRPARAEVPSAAEQEALRDRLTAANLEVLDRHLDEPEIAAFRERLADRDGRPDPATASDTRVRVRLEMIEAQRAALLDARDEGRFTSSALAAALENLDAEQISLELRSAQLE
ncbi:sodium/proton antiporter (CPA1 family) [Actinomycetospora succinea]|uniref:Sodium/proton antiporter (CPA1 family) n=1 Tax=Actinomycetospora succinea TaxID=663603 RepID=A0A4R6USL4_9PSEU|nr:cation:proton antiporter [Actinomycetospora succinea]TDQ50111.1 sodium/proton antiporter (CPA1 family) [Actinomycetospora succinea]